MSQMVGGQLRGDKECPFSGVTSSGRVWRKVPESDALSVITPIVTSSDATGRHSYCIITCAKEKKKSFSNRKSAGHFQAFLIASFPLIFLTRWTKPVLEEDKFLLELCFRLFLYFSVSL